MKKFILVSALMLNVVFVWGQISVANTAPVTQNFDGMLATTTLPTNWKMHASTSTPTYAAGSTNVTQQASTGSPVAGGTYNWGSTASERAVGAMTSGGFASPNNLMAFFRNTNSTDNITQLTIDYNAERYRINTAAASIQFFYSLNGSTWVAVTAGDIATASFPTGASSYTMASPLVVPKTGITISSLAIAPNSDFYLRWNINTTGSNSQGIGIDDVSVTATFLAPTNVITTTTLSSSTFTVNCSTPATGTIDFTSTGTFTAGNIYTAQLSNASGSFASPTSIGTLSSTANSGTINITIPAGTTTGSGYRIRVISSTPATTGTDNGSDISITLNPCTITTGIVSGGPFAVDCSTSDAGSVAFTSSGTFAVGNIFTAQLSNAAGSFASPTTIGTLTGASAEGLNPSGSVSFTIPSATATGSGYLIRVISSNPSVTGSNSASNTITLTGAPCTLTPIHVTSLLYDGCDVSCGAGAEGKSEIMFGTTGDYSMTPNATNTVLNYTTGGYIMTSTVTNNATTTTALNAAAGCPGLFVDAFGSTLAPNSSFLVVSENLCVSALTWSNLCGTGPIYVIYGGAGPSGATWHDGGNFGNSGNNNKNFTMTFTATDGTVFNQNYSYLAPSSATNGNYAKWNLNAGTPIEQGNMPNCDITPIALPSELIYFKGIADRNSILLNWETASEKNNDYFTLAHSIDGYNFITIGNVNGRGNTTETSDYSFEHLQPSTGVNYYKLTSTDYDGKRYNKGIIAVSVDVNSIYYNSITQTIELPKKSIIDIYTVDGKHLMQSDNETSIPFTHSGIFLIVDRLTGTTERIFIPVLQ
jgi:hypothetical protein